MYLLIKLYLIESNLLKLSLVSKSLIKLYLIKLHQVSNYVGYVSKPWHTVHSVHVHIPTISRYCSRLSCSEHCLQNRYLS